ncbi:MAG: hypothetical protein AAF709_10740, partial [Pseudomonadota bacterium]
MNAVTAFQSGKPCVTFPEVKLQWVTLGPDATYSGMGRASMFDQFAEEEQMLLDLVGSFVENELMPLEKVVMQREAKGESVGLLPEEEEPLLAKCKELGLWAL